MELLSSIAPKDLWPNADMFYRQIKERQKKEKTAGLTSPHKVVRRPTAQANSHRSVLALDDERSVDSKTSGRSGTT
ncbi:hypothetical protein EON65_08755 [archaeon]|nr:MAG: hypothetical protein EON65_08755 [archaeon]